MSKNTPGPWLPGRNGGAIVVLTKDDRMSARHAEADDWYGGHLIAESVSKYNRPLICAAPDLLAAVQSEHARLITERERPGISAQDFERIDRRIVDLEDLIERAGGEV